MEKRKKGILFFCPRADLLQLMWKLMWSRKSSFFSCKNSTNLLGLMHISASYLISFETTVYSTLAATDLPSFFLLVSYSGGKRKGRSALLAGGQICPPQPPISFFTSLLFLPNDRQLFLSLPPLVSHPLHSVPPPASTDTRMSAATTKTMTMRRR